MEYVLDGEALGVAVWEGLEVGVSVRVGMGECVGV
jgi:hypothetical protein